MGAAWNSFPGCAEDEPHDGPGGPGGPDELRERRDRADELRERRELRELGAKPSSIDRVA